MWTRAPTTGFRNWTLITNRIAWLANKRPQFHHRLIPFSWRIDENGAPELQQRPQTGLFAGLWGPEMATGLETTGCEFVGTIRHLLSHREMIVSVWKTVGTDGIDPTTVALSSLDRQILGLVGVIDNVP